MVLMTILSGLEGGMPSTCSSIVFTLCSLPSLVSIGFLTLMTFTHTVRCQGLYNISKALRGTGWCGSGRAAVSALGTRNPGTSKWLKF
jgi:hypothetical protein